jgi:hypothetical protein
LDPAQRAGGIIASQARSVISAAEAHSQEIREEARADARRVVADAVEDARAIRLRIDALADAASELLRDVRRSADRLTADLGFEPEVVSGVVQLTASSQPEEAEQVFTAPDRAVATPAPSESEPEPVETVSPVREQDSPDSEGMGDDPVHDDAPVDEDADAGETAGEPVDATLVEEEPEGVATADADSDDDQSGPTDGDSNGSAPAVVAVEAADAEAGADSDAEVESVGRRRAEAVAAQGKTVPCFDCQASGACSKCDGKGKRFLFRCSQCGGSGLCPTCGGPGFLWQ